MVILHYEALDMIFSITRTTIYLVCFFILPGFAIWSNSFNKTRRIHGDLLDNILSVLIYSFCLTSLAALVLAHIGQFALKPILLINCSISAFFILKGRGFSLGLFMTGWNKRSNLLLLVILAFASALYYSNPSEFIITSTDSGVYVVHGIHIAKQGSLTMYDPMLPHLEDNQIPLFYHLTPWHKEKVNSVARNIAGFFITDLETGAISPRYLYLYQSWIAIFYSIFGFKSGILLMTPTLALLALFTIFITIRRLMGDFSAFTATTLFGFNIIVVWFARYISTELAAQLLIWSGIYAFYQFVKHRSPFHGVLCGLSLAMSMFARIDSYFMIAPLAVGFLAYALLGRFERLQLYFLIPFVVTAGYSAMQMVTISYPYFLESFLLNDVPYGPLAALSVAYLASVVVGAIISRRTSLIDKAYPRLRPYLVYFIAFCLVILFIYADFIRPYIKDVHKPDIYGWDSKRSFREENLVRLGWYLGQPALLLGLFGLIAALRDKWRSEYFLFFSLGIFYTLFFVYYQRCNPFHFWVMRRFHPVVIPFILACAGYALSKIVNFKAIPLGIRRICIAILFVSIFFGYLKDTSRIALHREFRGLINLTEKVAKRLKPADIVITTNRVGVHFMMLFQHVYGIDTLMLVKKIKDSEALIDFIEDLLRQGRKIFHVRYSDEGYPPKQYGNIKFNFLDSFEFSTTRWHTSYIEVPKDSFQYEMSLQIFELSLVAEAKQ